MNMVTKDEARKVGSHSATGTFIFLMLAVGCKSELRRWANFNI
jgi:hypothetical protein